MKQQDRGSVLTGVILMVLVMTLIGVPLLGMVVFNYRLREVDNSLKRSEYEAEMAMDQVYLIIRETVIHAIDYAKANATQGVNATSEMQRTQYAAIKAKYEDLWISVTDNYGITEDNYQTEIVKDSVLKALNASAISNNLKEITTAEGEVKETTMAEGKVIYVNYKIGSDLDSLEADEVTGLGIGALVNSANGLIDDKELKLAYNTVFQYYYQEYINGISTEDNSDVVKQILIPDNYTQISSNVIVDDSKTEEKTYLKLKAELKEDEESENLLNVDVEVNFRKDANTLPAVLSATYVIDTPLFDSVTNVTQYTVPLSTPILNQGVIVGGTLEVADNTTLELENDITILTYDESGVNGKDVDDGIVLGKGAQLLAEANGTASASRIAVNGDIIMNANSQLSSGTNPLYYRNLYVGSDSEEGTYTIDFNGNVVAKDDLEINTEETVNITQNSASNYYGFNDSNDEGPDSSSSIVVNSAEVGNKTLRLGNLYLAGRAFIDGALSVRKNPVEDPSGDYIETETGEYIKSEEGSPRYRLEDIIYKTGESIAIKGNYIAYQTPLTSEDSEDYCASKVVFSPYFIPSKNNEHGKTDVPIYLVDRFIDDSRYDTFDSVHKWQYFMNYAGTEGNLLKKLDVTADVKYMAGTGFKSNEVIPQKVDRDEAFKENLAVEYEKYTQYIGYRPVDGDNVDHSKAKKRIFGDDGWISSDKIIKKPDEPDENYWLKYDMSTDPPPIELTSANNSGIIICKGNLTITVKGNKTFAGMIVVGGTLTINGGGKLHLTDAKEDVANLIIGNYLGTNTDKTGTEGQLFEIFKDDQSGSSYVVTQVNDNFTNINDLINITNWKKQNVGRL